MGVQDRLARSTELGQSVAERQIEAVSDRLGDPSWLFFIDSCRLSSIFRCWELNTSMNIWWIVRSLILLAVVVISAFMPPTLLPCCSLNDGQIDSRC